jgi:hypothetical protein
LIVGRTYSAMNSDIYCQMLNSLCDLFDVRTLYDCAKHVCQLGQCNSCNFVALHARNVAIADTVFDKDNLVAFLEGLPSRRGDADMRHVTGENDLLDAPLFQCLVKWRLLE